MKSKYIIYASILSVFLVAMSFVANFYFNLKFNLSDDPEDWAQFGDYYGGILNPLLSFFSIILLVRSIDKQVEANKSLRDEVERNKKSEKIRNFESLFFNMLDRMHNTFSSVYVENKKDESKGKINGVDVFSELEDLIFELLDNSSSEEKIAEEIRKFDSHDSIYSQFRCFYLNVTFIEDYLSDERYFDENDREKYYKALINFTDYSQVKIVLIFLQFMYKDFDNVKKVRNNSEFEKVLTACGLSYDVYKY